MGQYYKIVNLDKKEFFEACMVKLTEFSWRDNPSCNFLLRLLANDWAGDRVVVAGDYSEWAPEDIREESKKYVEENREKLAEDYSRVPEELDIYSLAFYSYKERFFSEFTLSPTKNSYKRIPYEISKEDWQKVKLNNRQAYKGKCILFEDYNTFIDLEAYYQKEVLRREAKGQDPTWIEFPVSILLATNDAGGGGDYNGWNAEEVVGMFLGSRVSIHKRGSRKLKGMTDFTNDLIIDETFEPEPSFEAEGIEGEIEGYTEEVTQRMGRAGRE